MKTILVILICIFSQSIYGQINVVGTISSTQTDRPLPYVNIGIYNKDKGTVSNENGEFELYIPDTYINDTIKISSIGFETKVFAVKDFIKIISENGNLSLSEKEIELQEVLVSNKKLKEKVIGNKTKSRMMRGGFKNSELGNELGIKIKIKRSPTYINKFRANLTSNTGEEMKFRLNFYDINKGLPDDRIIDESIIFKIDAKEGLFTLDLSQYDIIVEDDFFLTLELIENKGPKESEIFFSAGLLGNATVTRLTSQAKWEKLGMIGIGFSVTSEY